MSAPEPTPGTADPGSPERRPRRRDLRARIVELEAELAEERSRSAGLEAELSEARRREVVRSRPWSTSRFLEPVRFVRSLWP